MMRVGRSGLSSSDQLAQRESGLWVPEGLVSVERPTAPQRRFGEILAKYATIVLTVATGLAYLLGVWSVAQFSKGVGASAADLGFDFRDYLVLAALNLLPLAFGALIAIPAAVLTRRVNDTQRTLIRLAYLVVSFVALGIYFLSSRNNNYNLIALGLALYAGAASGWVIVVYLDPRGRRAPLRVASRVYIPLTVVTSALVISSVVDNVGDASEDYGFELANSAILGPASTDPPYGLDLLIDPALGFVSADDVGGCVMRIRANVVATGYRVVVLDNIGAFTLAPRCDLSGSEFAVDAPPVVAVREGTTERDIGEFNAALAAKVRVMPDSDFPSKALIAALTLCNELDDAASAERSATVIGDFGREFDLDFEVRAIVLRLTGEELCPAHRNAIRDYLELTGHGDDP